MIEGLSNAGATPVLEMMLRFAGQRQRIIAHNIANLDTPDFRPADVSPTTFQATMARAVDQRRARTGGEHGALAWKETPELVRDDAGELRLVPRTPSGNVLFHDRNNRDLERLMQDLAENSVAFRTAADLLRSRMDVIRAAISQRL